MIRLLYDLLVYVTSNYSSMPKPFKDRFSEKYLVRARSQLFSIIEFDKIWTDYE